MRVAILSIVGFIINQCCEMKTKVFKSSDFKRNKVVSNYGTTYRTEINSSLWRVTLVKVVALWTKRSPMNVWDLSLIKDGKRYTTMSDYINESDAWTRLTFDEQLRSVIEQAKLDTPIWRCCRILSLLEWGEFRREWDVVVRYRDWYHDDEEVCYVTKNCIEYLKERIANDIYRWWKMEWLEWWKVDTINNFLIKLWMATEE